MKHTKRINITDPLLWIFLSGLIAVCLIMPLFFELRSRTMAKLWILALIFPFTLFKLGKALFAPVYLTEDGIEFYRFGQLQRTLLWQQVAQVCVMNRAAGTRLSRSAPVIVIIPAGCPIYAGSEDQRAYLAQNRKSLIVAEFDRKRIQFIEKQHRKVTFFFRSRSDFNL